MFFGFILKNLPVIHKIPLPFLGSVGGLGSLIFLVSALYLAYKHRDVVTIIFAMLKFFVIALISLLFMLLTGGVYYFFRRSKIDKDIRQGLDITGLPKNMSGGGRRQKFSSRRKQKGGATSENSSELQQERNAQNKQLKKKVDGLISLIPVNILSELSKDYKKDY